MDDHKKDKDDKLLRVQQNLEDALSIKTHFLATVSHEIRTPVNGIVGMNQLLLETGLNERQKDYAKTANNCGYKLIETVDAILEYSSLQAGKLLIKEADFDLRSVLDKTIQKAQKNAAQKKKCRSHSCPRMCLWMLLVWRDYLSGLTI